MADEFLLQVRVAANALLTAKPDCDGKGPVLRLHWQNKTICLAIEALWCMFSTSVHQGVGCKVECDDDGLIVLPTKKRKAPLYGNISLQEFPASISRLMIFARSGWKHMSVPTVLSWPLYGGTDGKQTFATLPVLLGRQTVQKYSKTHLLFTHRAATTSKFDVFMRLLAKSFALPEEPLLLFGRVQYDLFYALVHVSQSGAFLQMVNFRA